MEIEDDKLITDNLTLSISKIDSISKRRPLWWYITLLFGFGLVLFSFWVYRESMSDADKGIAGFIFFAAVMMLDSASKNRVFVIIANGKKYKIPIRQGDRLPANYIDEKFKELQSKIT